jgi:hypothetical protein
MTPYKKELAAMPVIRDTKTPSAAPWRHSLMTDTTREPQPKPEGVEDRIAKLEADLDRERLRLAACGVVAMADTPESAAKARDMSPECHSASLADVIRQIDALMELRDALSQPEPKVPTVMEIIELADEIEAEGLGQVDLVRRALARWGRPATTTETP